MLTFSKPDNRVTAKMPFIFILEIILKLKRNEIPALYYFVLGSKLKVLHNLL